MKIHARDIYKPSFTESSKFLYVCNRKLQSLLILTSQYIPFTSSSIVCSFPPRFIRSYVIIDQFFAPSDVSENQTHVVEALIFVTHWCHFQHLVFDVMHERDHVTLHNLLHRDVTCNHPPVRRVHSSPTTKTPTHPHQISFLIKQRSCCEKNRNRFFDATSSQQNTSKTQQLLSCCVDLICDQIIYIFVCFFCFVKFPGC